MIVTRIIALGAAAGLGLAACQPLPNQTNENLEQGALIGAGVGAVAGALTGGDRGDSIRNAVAGGIIGAGVGGAIGAQLDRQEAELRAQLGPQVGIVNNGNSLTVSLPQDILFATESAQLTGSLQSDLRTVAGSLNRYPNTTVNVVGHTDNTGEAAFNQDLSERRAQAVSSVLIDSGVAPSRIRTVGRGEDQPIASNLTPEGRAQNRRVEIVIIPRG